MAGLSRRLRLINKGLNGMIAIMFFVMDARAFLPAGSVARCGIHIHRAASGHAAAQMTRMRLAQQGGIFAGIPA